MKYVPCDTVAGAAASLRALRRDLPASVIREELTESVSRAAREFPEENPVTLAHGWLWEEYRCGVCESRDSRNYY